MRIYFLIFGSLIVLDGCFFSKQKNKLSAVAIIESKSGSRISGKAVFEKEGNFVNLYLKVRGLKPRMQYAVHLHNKGDCSASDGSSAGGHWNPENSNHGRFGDNTKGFHLGDIGNLTANDDGNVFFTMNTSRWTMDNKISTTVIGKSIIIHEKADDFTSQPTGNAGARIGCGVIRSSR